MTLEELQEYMDATRELARAIHVHADGSLVIVEYHGGNFDPPPNVAVITDDAERIANEQHRAIDANEINRVLAFIQDAGYAIIKEEDLPF